MMKKKRGSARSSLHSILDSSFLMREATKFSGAETGRGEKSVVDEEKRGLRRREGDRIEERSRSIDDL